MSHRQRRCRRVLAQSRDTLHAAVAEAETAAGKSDLAEHRSQRDRSPKRLLAVIGALQRPVHRDEAALRGHPAREAANLLRRNLAETRSPVSVFRNAV